ncbi:MULTISPECIES: hypothetical protein [unclassified Agarivorans]|uniref:hypothetical protein n=1 Tax=unclassified Agarivorans TaxID=2636026 RepID=UPI0026E24C59|nr:MULTISPECIES: hypothetical protein [unclassified Agarivorans]MDO6687276.1 hypothetical protein [Agarivorans sp. 3_MG-2023]MDO6716797.1 hypothetical protein [Agarivorans sp. 2_MG-2023]
MSMIAHKNWNTSLSPRCLFKPSLIALVAGLALSHGVSAANFTANSASQLSARLADAANNGPGVDVITIQGSIFTGQQIDVQTPVIIQGDSGFRVSRVIRTSTDGFQPLFNIQSHNVTIRNLLLIDQNGQNTNTQVAAEAGNDHSNARLINIPYEDAYQQITNITIENNTFENTPVGIASSGLIPHNLTISNNDFIKVNRSVELLRDVGRVYNVWNVNANNVVLNGGTLNISNNRIRGNRVRLGISVDAGNDGVYVPPSFTNIPFFDAAARAQFSDKPVVFANGSQVNSNIVEGANEFGIALATVANLSVSGNTVSTTEDDINSSADIENNFTAGINVEHNAANIVVDSNTITVGASGNFATGINVLSFQDHHAPLNHAQASKNITLVRNTFKGTGENTILGFGFSNLVIQDNDASQFTTRNPYQVTASFYNVPCGLSTSTARGTNTNIRYNQSAFNGTGNAPQYYDKNGNVVSGYTCQ